MFTCDEFFIPYALHMYVFDILMKHLSFRFRGGGSLFDYLVALHETHVGSVSRLCKWGKG